MKTVFAALLAGHGLIHLIGVAKAFGVAEAPQLSVPIPAPTGLLWLTAALMHLAAAFSLYAWPRWWWALAGCAVVVSQIVIVTSWADAKWGTLANLLIALGVAYAYLSLGPFSFQAEFDRAVAQALKSPDAVLTQPHHAAAELPAAVAKYLRIAGAENRSGLRNFRAKMRGEIRSEPAEPWMKFTAEQFNTFGENPSRIFLMKASKAGVPFEALHVYAGGKATMRVKLASLWTVADAKGPELDQAETVTVFNDLCLFAPSALASAAVQWADAGEHSVRAIFSNKGHSIGATLAFAQSGELTNFVSDDRSRSASDGKHFQQMRWSTPVTNYRDFGAATLWSKGEAWWHPQDGGFAYGRFELLSVEYDVGRVREPATVSRATHRAPLAARGAR